MLCTQMLGMCQRHPDIEADIADALNLHHSEGLKRRVDEIEILHSVQIASRSRHLLERSRVTWTRDCPGPKLSRVRFATANLSSGTCI